MTRLLALTAVCLLIILSLVLVSQALTDFSYQVGVSRLEPQMILPEPPEYLPEAPDLLLDQTFLRLVFTSEGPFKLLSASPEPSSKSRYWQVLEPSTDRQISYLSNKLGGYQIMQVAPKAYKAPLITQAEVEKTLRAIADRLLGLTPPGHQLEMQITSNSDYYSRYSFCDSFSPGSSVKLVEVTWKNGTGITSISYFGPYLSTDEFAKLSKVADLDEVQARSLAERTIKKQLKAQPVGSGRFYKVTVSQPVEPALVIACDSDKRWHRSWYLTAEFKENWCAALLHLGKPRLVAHSGCFVDAHTGKVRWVVPSRIVEASPGLLLRERQLTAALAGLLATSLLGFLFLKVRRN